jgi:hypothetical protein
MLMWGSTVYIYIKMEENIIVPNTCSMYQCHANANQNICLLKVPNENENVFFHISTKKRGKIEIIEFKSGTIYRLKVATLHCVRILVFFTFLGLGLER